MKRAIVQRPDLSGAALAELRQWLGITGNSEDSLLAGLLLASLEMCEAFTGQLPLEAGCEETLGIDRGWLELASRPVRAITGCDIIGENGVRTALSAAQFEIDIDPSGTGKVRLIEPVGGRALVVSHVSGLAADWSALAPALQHGIIRLAAQNYRDRDNTKPLGPPASVAALWHPWRQLRVT